MPNPSRPRRCPICRQPTSTEFDPFCSRGCKDRDLLKWLGEGYRVPGSPADPERVLEAQNRLDSDDPDRL